MSQPTKVAQSIDSCPVVFGRRIGCRTVRTIRTAAWVVCAVAALVAAVASRAWSSPSGGGVLERYGRGVGGQEVVASDFGFRAEFPTAAQRSTHDVEDVTVTIWGCTVDGSTFAVSAFTLADGSRSLTQVMRESAKAMGGRPVVLRGSRVDGFDAVRYELRTAAKSTIAGLAVRTPTRMYQVQVLDADGKAAAVDRFLGSFALDRALMS